MIIIIALIVLFVIFFILKKHVGPAILASLAGVTVYNSTYGFYPFLQNIIKIPSSTIANIMFLILVLVFPLVIYIFSSKNWSPMIIRIPTSIIAAVVIVSFCTGLVDFYSMTDAIGKNIINFITSYCGFINIAGIALAYFDTIIYRVA